MLDNDPMLDQETLHRIEETRKQHPFLTFLVMETNEIKVGIVQNETMKLMMFYDFEKIRNEEERKEFLELADEWWWGSNQSIPVNAFCGDRFDKFQSALSGYPKKSIRHPIGPTFSLQNQYLRRIKKKKIELISRARADVNRVVSPQAA